MSKPDYDTTLARMAGNIAAGLAGPASREQLDTNGVHDWVVMRSLSLARAIVAELRAAPAAAPAPPQLEWTRDEDGDWLVALTGFPNITLTVHGKTQREALHLLGDAMEGAFMDDCPDPSAHVAAPAPPRSAPCNCAASQVLHERTCASLAAAPAQAEGWQPIETAPKDHRAIIVYVPGARSPVQEVWWAQSYEEDTVGYWSTPMGPAGRGYTILIDAPTHWMPLPVPPSAPDAEPE